jgi:hypothetical protein
MYGPTDDLTGILYQSDREYISAEEGLSARVGGEALVVGAIVAKALRSLRPCSRPILGFGRA